MTSPANPPASPRDRLARWLRDNDTAISELSRRAKMPQIDIQAVLHDRPLRDDIARKLAPATGIPYFEWLRLEIDYRLHLAKTKSTSSP